VISELHKEITGEELPSQTFRVFAESWLVRKGPEVSPATLVFYKNAVGKFTRFLGAKADVEMTGITADDVMRFRNHESKTLAPKTVNHDLKCLRMLFNIARRDRIISEDPTEFVNTTKKAQTQARRPFTIPEIQAVLSVADDEWRSMIRFGLYTGQRLGDLAMLTWQNVDLLTRRDPVGDTEDKQNAGLTHRGGVERAFGSATGRRQHRGPNTSEELCDCAEAGESGNLSKSICGSVGASRSAKKATPSQND